MTLVNAIQELMNKGITQFHGFTAQSALDNAVNNDMTAARVVETGNGDVKSWQYHIDHADDYFIIETNDHHIIATYYENSKGTRFAMEVYGDYETEQEMTADFDEWEIAKQANEIADGVEKSNPGNFPREALVMLATMALRSEAQAAQSAFIRDFPPEPPRI
jgi:hypothetical protein